MFSNNCKICNNEIFQQENTIGKPLEYDICRICWEDMPDDQRQKFIKDGVVPITRFVVTDEWRQFCDKYGMKP